MYYYYNGLNCFPQLSSELFSFIVQCISSCNCSSFDSGNLSFCSCSYCNPSFHLFMLLFLFALVHVVIPLFTGSCCYYSLHWFVLLFLFSLVHVVIPLCTGSCCYSSFHRFMLLFLFSLVHVVIPLFIGSCCYSSLHWFMLLFLCSLVYVVIPLPRLYIRLFWH